MIDSRQRDLRRQLIIETESFLDQAFGYRPQSFARRRRRKQTKKPAVRQTFAQRIVRTLLWMGV